MPSSSKAEGQNSDHSPAPRTLEQQCDAAILVHLFPTVPGCDLLPSNHPDVWRWFYNRRPMAVVAALLTRIGAAPGAVELVEAGTDTLILGESPLCPDAGFVTLASICTGATFEQLEEARQDLIDAGWLPAALATAQRRKAA